MNRVVLDTSAFLAVAFDERGTSVVMEHQPNAIVSAVNHSEVVSKLLRFQMPMSDIVIFLSETFPEVGRIRQTTIGTRRPNPRCAQRRRALLRGLFMPSLSKTTWDSRDHRRSQKGSLSSSVEINLIR